MLRSLLPTLRTCCLRSLKRQATGSLRDVPLHNKHQSLLSISVLCVQRRAFTPDFPRFEVEEDEEIDDIDEAELFPTRKTESFLSAHHSREPALQELRNSTLDSTTSYFRGSVFEHEAIRSLEQFSNHNLVLKHVGGPNDGGVDFIGEWILPVSESGGGSHINEEQGFQGNIDVEVTHNSTSRQSVSVVGQCKLEKTPVGPKHIREFDGVLGGTENSSSMGFFVSGSGYTQAALATFESILHPAVLVVVSPPPPLQRSLERSAAEKGNSIVRPIQLFKLNAAARKKFPDLKVGVSHVLGGRRLSLVWAGGRK